VETIDSLASALLLAPGVTRLKGIGLNDEAVIALTQIPSLTELDLSGCDQVTDVSVSRLKKINGLEILDLSFCNQISDASLVQLAELENLRSLNLNWCYAVTDGGLSALAKCSSLQSLSLWGCEEVTDLGVTALAKLPILRSLDLPEFASITDASLIMLSDKAQSLECLRLDHLTTITDDGIRQLGKMFSLSVLTIQSCPNITASAIKDLQSSLPECKIAFIP
jgi:hypothetical protein